MKIDTNKLDWIDKPGDVGGIALLTTRIQKFYGDRLEIESDTNAWNSHGGPVA